jgi:hypothetical protein
MLILFYKCFKILQNIWSYLKKDWLHFDPPPPKPVEKVNAFISATIKPLRERLLYVVFVSFPRTMQKHIMMS